MIPLRAGEVAGVALAAGDGGRVIDRVTVDSRTAGPGALFVALRGEHADGHEFLGAAAAAGASAVLCAPGWGEGLGDVAVLHAPTPLAALQGLARQVRRRSAANVVGIAGSAGKTSTKDVLRALCAAHVPTVATHANHNNELGVPLTLCRIDPDTRVAACELAMRAPGEIAELTAIAEPGAGLITNVGPEHLEFLGSVENVARAEAELLAGLPAGGLAVLPHEEPLLEPFRRDDVREVTFGLGEGADVHPLRAEAVDAGTRLELAVLGERATLTVPLRGGHMVANVCAAVAVYAGLGLPVDGVGEGAGAVELSPWRGQERALPGGGVLVNDAYNANPISMRAALDALAARAAGRRTVAVLGEMAELGAESAAWHRQVGAHAGAAGVDVVVGVGPLARGYCEAASTGAQTHWYAAAAEAAAALPALVRPGDVILLKASRSVGLERLEEALA